MPKRKSNVVEFPQQAAERLAPIVEFPFPVSRAQFAVILKGLTEGRTKFDLTPLPPVSAVGAERVDAKAADLPFHPAADKLPLMDKGEFETLVASIKANGLHTPIKLYADGSIIDGRNRCRACREAGVKPVFEDWAEYDDTPPDLYVAIQNVHRRHLTPGWRARHALDMSTATHGGDRKSSSSDQTARVQFGGNPKPITQAEAALACGVSVRLVANAARILREAEPEVVAQFKADKITINRALYLMSRPADEQLAAPDVKFAGRKARSPRMSIPFTTTALKTLTDDQALAVVEKLLPAANRALVAQGRKPLVLDASRESA
jgi:hypothetical protein